ncbi:unnamed protein product [Callosobruchus maculatus]|uniref:Uncharacterized protein n=1 Tax=Callosobruchus maculatus TaxID=64391 RepID=A0A653DXI6_CALMS|nr:unnamed protein product [Callosobruchus maculatus]
MSARTGENVNTYLTDIIAKYFGITLSKSERERRNPVVTAEIFLHPYLGPHQRGLALNYLLMETQFVVFNS